MKFRAIALLAGLWLASPLSAQDAVERGRAALLERAFVPAAWSQATFDDLWKKWTPRLEQKPKDYAAAFTERYGLPPAPFPNNDLPLGLRHGKTLLGFKGITTDCMLCHGGSLLGKSYVGLGNSTIDLQGLFEDLISRRLPYTFSNVRGTTEAGATAVYLLALREPDLKIRLKPHPFRVRDDLCEDTPAWWLLRKKKTMYHTGSSHARSVRSIMQFMLTPANPPGQFEREEATFADIQAYLLSLEAPKYPFPIDAALASKGHVLFGEHCARCHGTYGPGATYPNKIVPIDVIGTDRTRFEGIALDVARFYNQSWFAQEKGADGYKVSEEPIGYQAPPLDGVWATAPYLHNGSVPTLADVLDSKSAPRCSHGLFAPIATHLIKPRSAGKSRCSMPWTPNSRLMNAARSTTRPVPVEGTGAMPSATA